MPENPGTLILRSDASTAMGTGHVMRCFALAQAWQDAGGQAVFAMAEGSPAMRQRLLAENMEVVPLETSAGSEDDAKRVTELASRYAADWVVVDGYQFGAGYQHQLKAAGLRLLFLDDHGHAGHYSADFVLNQNAHAQEFFYEDREAYTRLLLGPRYAMLRREFALWRDWKREIPDLGLRILITMGGSDPDNIASRAIEALSLVQVDGLEAVVVVGGSNPHLRPLEETAARCAVSVRLQSNASNMPDLMAWADVAISAAGTTAWELAFMSTPTTLLALAQHQWPVAQAVESGEAGVNLGRSSEAEASKIADAVRDLLFDASRRERMAINGRRLVDGYGVERVIASLTERKFANGTLRTR